MKVAAMEPMEEIRTIDIKPDESESCETSPTKGTASLRKTFGIRVQTSMVAGMTSTTPIG